MKYLMSGIGVLLALGFMAVTAVINWRYGELLGRELMDQRIYAATSMLGDISKAVVPFFIWWAVKNKRGGVAVAGAMVWLLASGYSLTSLLGFAEFNRASTSGTISAKSTDYRDLRTELERKQKERAAFGTFEPASVVESKLAALQQDKRWLSSQQCKDATTATSREFCASYNTMSAGKSKALEAVRLDGEIDALRQKVGALAGSARIEEGDAQASALGRLSGWQLLNVQTGLSVWFVVMLELGSSLGLFIALNHGELQRAVRESAEKKAGKVNTLRPPPPDVVRPVPSVTDKVGPSRALPAPVVVRPTGDVAKFARARIEVVAGASVGLDQLHADYCVWCETSSSTALSRSEFEARFGELAKLVEFVLEKRGKRIVCRDVKLVGKAA